MCSTCSGFSAVREEPHQSKHSNTTLNWSDSSLSSLTAFLQHDFQESPEHWLPCSFVTSTSSRWASRVS